MKREMILKNCPKGPPFLIHYRCMHFYYVFSYAFSFKENNSGFQNRFTREKNGSFEGAHFDFDFDFDIFR